MDGLQGRHRRLAGLHRHPEGPGGRPLSGRELLADLPVGIEPLLTSLVAASERGRDIGATLHLRGGRDLSGVPVARLSESNGAWWVLRAAGVHRGDVALTYVPVAAVEAITLLDAHALREHVASLKAAPSRPDLQRAAAQASKSATAALGRAITVSLEELALTEGAARAAAELCRRTEALLVALAQDKLGREALEAIGRVQLRGAETLRVTRLGDALVIEAALDGLASVPHEAALRDAVEAAI